MKIRLLEGRDMHPLIKNCLRERLAAVEDEDGICRDVDGKPLRLDRFIDAAILDKLFWTSREDEAIRALAIGFTVLLIEEEEND